MVSDQVLLEALEGIKEVSGCEVCISDADGVVISGTFNPGVDVLNDVISFIVSGEELYKAEGICITKEFYPGENMTFFLTMKGDSPVIETFTKMAALQIRQLCEAYDSKTPVNDFIGSVLTESILDINIDREARQLGVDIAADRIVFVAEAADEDGVSRLLEEAKRLFSTDEKSYVVVVGKNKIAVVTGCGEDEDTVKKASELYESLGKDKDLVSRVGYGSVTADIFGLSESFSEAMTAVDAGRMFFPGRQVISCDRLGLGRLIMELPTALCERFLTEHFKRSALDNMDAELLATINAFFDNSLNISETARQLFVHRNTLIYRLNKVQKITGLDVRKFDDAITFKVSVMVHKKIENTK